MIRSVFPRKIALFVASLTALLACPLPAFLGEGEVVHEEWQTFTIAPGGVVVEVVGEGLHGAGRVVAGGEAEADLGAGEGDELVDGLIDAGGIEGEDAMAGWDQRREVRLPSPMRWTPSSASACWSSSDSVRSSGSAGAEVRPSTATRPSS